MNKLAQILTILVLTISLAGFASARNNSNGPRFGGDQEQTQFQGQGQEQNQFQAQGQLQGQAQSSINKNRNTNLNSNLNLNTNSNSNENNNTNLNFNNNSNKNTNKNTAVGVGVGVGVSSADNEVNNEVSNEAVNTTVNNVNNELTIEGDQREFPNQGNVTFGSLLSAEADENPSEQFIKLKHLTMYSSILSVEEAKEMIDGNFYGKRVKIVPKVEKVDVPSDELNLVGEKLDIELYDVKVVGFGVAVATSDKSISAGLLAKAVVEASEYGATHLQFMAEGTTKQLQASGWGIGFSSTKADSSNTIQTGGTGYSSATSSYAKLPWQQFMVLKVTKK